MTEKEKAIQNFITSLDISREEAEQLWEDDQEDFIGEEGEEMTAKAKKNIKRYEKSDKPRKKVVKEHKVDTEKKELIEVLTNALSDFGISIDSVKNEAEFSFHHNENSYSVKLIKHRAKKG